MKNTRLEMSGGLLLRGYRRINRRKPRSINNQGIQRKETPHFPKVAKFVREPQCLAFSIFNFKDMGLTPWCVKHITPREDAMVFCHATQMPQQELRHAIVVLSRPRFMSDFATEPLTFAISKPNLNQKTSEKR